MIKFEKYELSAFTGKKINKFGQKAKIFEKNENAHEIRKKTTVLCPGVITTYKNNYNHIYVTLENIDKSLLVIFINFEHFLQ